MSVLAFRAAESSSEDVLAGAWFTILSEPRPRRDVAASETLAETLKLPRVSGALTSHRDVFRDVW